LGYFTKSKPSGHPVREHSNHFGVRGGGGHFCPLQQLKNWTLKLSILALKADVIIFKYFRQKNGHQIDDFDSNFCY
jgi:hypothetical protein